jgi:pSer/pThr/pTyr-binding forkhead associated (FHA) protein
VADSRTLEHAVRRPPFGAPHVWIVAVVDGDDPEALHRLSAIENVVGRGPEAAVAVEDDEVSKRHAVIRLDGPVCTITDLGSRNGTWVNDRRLRPAVAQRLRHLDEILVGTTRLLVLAGRTRSPKR